MTTEQHHAWDTDVEIHEARNRPDRDDVDDSLPPVFLWRGSVSRPWQIERNTPSITDRVHYAGPMRRVLIESVMVEELSKQNIEYGLDSGHFDQVVVIRPQRGHGYALDYAIRKLVEEPFMLKWEDDFRAEQDINLTTCVRLMQEHDGIHQIAFNKRANQVEKLARPKGEPEYFWQFKERVFDDVTLTIAQKWWFGPSLWRVSFIRPLWRFFRHNVHNAFNDHVLFPRIPGHRKEGRYPTPEQMEEYFGAYWWGPRKHPRMTEHTGKGDSLWAGEFQQTAKEKGWKLEG